jgi:hypothetical protein
MIIDSIKIYELENGQYIVEYLDENNQKQTTQFENSLLATQFFNTLIITS